MCVHRVYPHPSSDTSEKDEVVSPRIAHLFTKPKKLASLKNPLLLSSYCMINTEPPYIMEEFIHQSSVHF